ncbi:hypothetical protein [Gordonia humi]|uniref:Uncharacterized protein n=1 Tax=Gordonia humi TaxID=686429 RepID=A0A840ETA2_9ACTN|nr:hypothetical protein [Gordonia humi]MBB4134791.1 hypothetical protein [Gordonia humi]
MSEQKIDIHVQSGTGEILRIVSTLLLFGGAGGLAWTVAQGPNAEMAASGFSMMIVMMIRLAYGAGRISVPARGQSTDDFAVTKGVVAQMIAEYQRALAKANLPVMTLIAAAYAIAFLVLRAGVSAALGIFSNLYIAGFSAAMVGAVVVFPSLLPSILASLKRKGVVTDVPQAPVASATPAPVQQAPVSAPVAPAPEPVQPTKRVVRRVVKKETPNV